MTLQIGGRGASGAAAVRTFLVVLTSWGIAAEGYCELRIYPPPGDLSSVEHLRESQDYSVRVNGKACFVYETDNYWERSSARRPDKVAFACFSFRNERATVEVTCGFAANSVTIRPKSYGIPFRRHGNRIAFTLSRPRKISVEVNNRKRPLFIFADEPDEPDTTAHHYFAPGVHHIGAKYGVDRNERVYIAGGAVVEGTLMIHGPNAKIRGRGILSGGQLTSEQWRKDKKLSLISADGRCDRQEISGICMLNSPGWFTAGLAGNHAVLRNLKVIGWLGCTDGPGMYGRHGIYEDCFFFSNDDILKLNVKSHWVIRNHVIWKGPWGRAITSLAGGKTDNENMTVENVDIIGDEGIHQGRSAIFASFRIFRDRRKRGYRKDFTFRNIRVEGPREAPLFYFDATGFEVSNFTFENITVEDHKADEGLFRASEGGVIDGIHFKSLVIGGRPMGSLSEAHIATNGAVSNVTFRQAMPKEATRRSSQGRKRKERETKPVVIPEGTKTATVGGTAVRRRPRDAAGRPGAASDGKPRRADNVVDPTAPREPAEPRRLLKEAERLFIDGDLKKAGELFRRIVEEHPDTRSAGKARDFLVILE